MRPDASTFTVILLTTWLILWAVAEGALAATLLHSPPDSSPNVLPALFLAALAPAGLFVAWRLLWLIAGREVVSLTRGALSIRRSILEIGRTHTFPIGEIRNIRIGTFQEDPIYPAWGRMFVGKGPCYVVFQHGEHNHRFARGVAERQAQYLIHLLKDHHESL